MTMTEAPPQSTLPADVQKAITDAFEELREKAWTNEDKLAKAKVDDNQPKAWLSDPFALLDSVGMGYRNAPTYLTYDTLRQVAERDTFVSAILLTRIDQVAAFTRPQENKYSIGFKIRPRHGDKKRRLTDSEKDRMQELTMFMLNTGREYNLGRDSFEQFIRKFVRDSLTYDQACHPAGTLVHLANGSAVPIEDLKIGMSVWTHLGRVRRITKVMRRSYTGEMFRVVSGGQSITCTEGHPLLAEPNKWCNIAFYKERGYEPQWLGPEELSKGAYLTSPWLQPEVGEDVIVPEYGKLDTNIASLLGLYTAEGHSQGVAATFTFSSDEEHLVEFVEGVAKLIGRETKRVEYQDRNAIGVRINGGDAGGAFTSWLAESCGRGSNHKRVPPFILTASSEIRRAFLQGYLLGDGRALPGGTSFTTTSSDLFFGVRALFAMEKIYAREIMTDYGAYGWSDQRRANISGSKWRSLAEEIDFPRTTKTPNEPYVADSERAYLKISKIERWSVVDEPVFNCEVEEDHSYLANGFASHNCAEKVRTRSGTPFSFQAVPSDTIRTATPKNLKGTPPRLTEVKKDVRYVQVINSSITAEFTLDEMCFAVRNPRSNVRAYGYGFPEIETLMSTITSHLWAEEWNRKMFCVAPGTYVTTKHGLKIIDDLVDEKFSIWNGREWCPATAYATGRRAVVRTKLWNGIELETSQKHRFRVIPRESETGEPAWRQQKELKRGDYALVGYACSDAAMDEEALLVGRFYDTARSWGKTWTPTSAVVNDVEFWEMVGFALGDGYWPILGAVNANGNREPQWLKIFPHHTLDSDARTKFLRMCERHGINASLTTNSPNHQRSDGEFGYPTVTIQHRAFVEWLYDLGFQPTSLGKRLPPVLMSSPAWLRAAVMRGLFSADGHAHRHTTKEYVTPTLACTAYPKLRQDVLRCMWSIGVATNDVGEGWNRKGELDVQDVDAFVERVGYMQAYKNEGIERERKTGWDRLPDVLSMALAKQIRSAEKWMELSKLDRDLVCKAARGACGLSRPRVSAILRLVGLPVPDALSYVLVPIDVLDEQPGEAVQMFDVEVFDDEHMFLANHVAVHNSQGSTIKGLLNIKGNIPQVQFEAFKRSWHSQVAGVQNAWKTPMLNSEDVQWTPLQLSNTEMGYQMWMEYLVKVTSALFRIDPAEINFDLRGGVGQQPVFMSTNEAQQKASKDRGLQPLLRFVEDTLNRHIVWQIDPRFEIAFLGLDAKTEEQAQALRTQQVTNTLTLNEARAMDDLPPVQYGDVVLNPTYIGYKMQKLQMAQMAQQQAQMAQQPQGGGAPGQPAPPPTFQEPPGAEEEHGADQLRQFAEPKAGDEPTDDGSSSGSDDESSGPNPQVLSRLHIDDWDSVVSHSLRSDDLMKSELFDTIDLD